MIKNRNIAPNAYIDPTKIGSWGSLIGNTYYVAPAGDAYDYLIDRVPESKYLVKTITEGIALLDDYDTLYIAPGNYDEAATVTLTGKKGVRIIGFTPGMMWGEGLTCWRDVTSTDDLFDITGCMGVEIANISFVVTTTDKDAINFTGLNYSTHIHDCSFIGDCGSGAVMAYAINAAGSNSADLYVHHCRFFRVKTTAIKDIGQRAVIEYNKFIIPASGYGINGINASAGYNVISDNGFLGANSSDTGINIASITAGNVLIMNNMFANVGTDLTGGSTGGEVNCVNNKHTTATGGAEIDPT